MILSILVTKNKIKIYINYIIAAIVCLIIAYIYSLFGHGVTSAYMTFMFLYPLIGGIPVLFIKDLNRFFISAYSCGIATLTVGSFVQGVFKIAGTSSEYPIIYYIVGVFLIFIAFIKKK